MVSAKQGGDLLGLRRGVRLTLLLATLLLEFLQSIFIADIAFLLIKCIYQLPEIHDSGCSFVHIPEFLLCEAEHLEGVVGELKILIVINALNLGLSL